MKLSGADVTLNQEILVADIGNLVFTPAQDADGDRATTPSTSRSTTAPSTQLAANTITVDVTGGAGCTDRRRQDGHHQRGYGLRLRGG